jgi:hypothetical protein
MTASQNPRPRRERNPLRRLNEALRGHTEGLSIAELARLFERETANAYSVLNRSNQLRSEPKDDFERFLYRSKVIFFGFYTHLGPTRRILFVVSLLFFLFGMLDWGFAFDISGRLIFDSSPFWFVLSTLGLVLALSLAVVDQVRVRDELEVARDLQRELLPTVSPLLPGYTIVHTYQPAGEVGGDYYDFCRLSEDRIALMVGDASGHGIAAGLLMATANATLKLAIDLDPEPRAVLELLNRALVNTGDTRSFMSLWYGVLDLSDGRIDYACAAHPYPVLRRPDGSLLELGQGSFPLGVRKHLEVCQGTARLLPGDLLVLYSDGLPEATGKNSEAFGYGLVSQLIAKIDTPRQVHDVLLERLRGHLGDVPLQDDFSLVVVGRNPPLPPLPIPSSQSVVAAEPR